jgi:hypothetical protein
MRWTGLSPRRKAKQAGRVNNRDNSQSLVSGRKKVNPSKVNRRNSVNNRNRSNSNRHGLGSHKQVSHSLVTDNLVRHSTRVNLLLLHNAD